MTRLLSTVRGTHRPPSCRLVLGAVALAGVAIFGTACQRAAYRETLPLLTNTTQVRELPLGEPERGYPVRLRGITTYHHASSASLILQAGADGILIDVSRIQTPIVQGREIEIIGATGVRDASAIVEATALEELRPSPPPDATPVSIADLQSGRFSYRWVEAAGVVRSARVENDRRFTMTVASADGVFQARVNGSGPGVGDGFIDSKVRLRGVALTTFNMRGQPVRLQILVPSLDEIAIQEAGAADPFSVPVQTIAAVRRAGETGHVEHRVRVQGVIARAPDGRVLVTDDTGSIAVGVQEMTSLGPDMRADVSGFIAGTGPDVMLDAAGFRAIEASPPTSPDHPSPSGPAAHARAPIVTIAAVRRLPPVEARRGFPVHFRGVVTYWMKPRSFGFVQDATGGIFIVNDGSPVEPGQLVEVTGETAAGDFAPIVDKAIARVIGRAALPTPIRVTIGELFSGRYDSQWVETEGTVHAVVAEGANAVLTLASGSYKFKAVLPDLGSRLPTHLVDGKVRIQGACGSIFNDRRQLLSIQVLVPGMSQLTIVGAPPAAAQSLPVQPINALLQFDPEQPSDNRVRVQGTVTMRRANGSVFVADGTGGVPIQAPRDVSVAVGDRVDVVGFPAQADYLAVLEDAVFQKREAGPVPAASFITADEAMSGNHHAQLVQMEGYVLERVGDSTRTTLTLQAGQRVFTASI